MRKKVPFLTVLAVALTLCTSNTLLASPDYPERAISIILPFAPGGGADIPTRTFAAFAEKFFGKPVVVVYKPGATGMVGFLAGAQAAPDGYTLTVGTTATTGAIEWELINGRKPSATQQDFVTIGSFTLSPALVSVPYDSPWKTLADLINDCKSKPGHYAFSSGGLYSGMSHASSEVLIAAAGLKVRHIPFHGGGPAINAVVGGHVDFTAQFPATTVSLYHGKKVRILAVLGDRRLKSIPEIPTAKELGVNAEHYSWVGILAPKGTPKPIVDKLKEVISKAVEDKSFVNTMETAGEDVRYMDDQQLARFWEGESERIGKLWAKLFKEAPPTK